MSSDDILRGIKLEILLDKRMEIVTTLNPDRHYDYMRSKRLLSREDVEEIKCQETQQKRAGLFLDRIVQNGPNSAFDVLCQSILVADKTRLHLLTLLNKEYENKWNNFKVLMESKHPRSQMLEIAVDPTTLPRPQKTGMNFPVDQEPYNDLSASSPSSLKLSSSAKVINDESNI